MTHLHKLVSELRQIKLTYGCSPKIVMEATGNYSLPLAQFFYLQGFEVFVLNPLMTHAVKRKAIRKIKTDPIDVHRIAHAFYTSHDQYAYEPQDDVTTALKELTRQCFLKSVIFKRFKSKKQLTAYAGLDPSIFQSGKFTASNNKISKRGSAYLRKALYQATFIGIGKRGDHPVNPILHEYYMSKKSQGKHGKVALVATCSKLLNMIYGILSTETPFENQLI